MCVSTYLHGNSDLPPNVSEGAIPVVAPSSGTLVPLQAELSGSDPAMAP